MEAALRAWLCDGGVAGGAREEAIAEQEGGAALYLLSMHGDPHAGKASHAHGDPHTGKASQAHEGSAGAGCATGAACHAHEGSAGAGCIAHEGSAAGAGCACAGCAAGAGAGCVGAGCAALPRCSEEMLELGLDFSSDFSSAPSASAACFASLPARPALVRRHLIRAAAPRHAAAARRLTDGPHAGAKPVRRLERSLAP